MSDPRPHTDWEDLLPLLALDALAPEESRQVEEHTKSCPSCAEELESLRLDLSLVAESVAPIEASQLSRRRLLDSLPEKPTQGLRSVGPASLSRFLAWAAGFGCLVLGLSLFWTLAELSTARNERDRMVARFQLELEGLKAEATALAGELGVLTSPDARQISLAGLEEAPNATALAYVDSAAGVARFYAFRLPEAPAGHDYQLWTITGGVPVSAGVFAVDRSGSARVQVAGISDLGSVEAWAVTIEPAGGVPQPTGPMVLISS